MQGVGVGRGAAGADGAGEEVCGEDFHCGWVLRWEGGWVGKGGEGSGGRCGCGGRGVGGAVVYGAGRAIVCGVVGGMGG